MLIDSSRFTGWRLARWLIPYQNSGKSPASSCQ
jgi:hypothetical protein